MRRAVDGGTHERLHLEEEGARAVEHRADGRAAEPVFVHRDQHFGGILDLAEAGAGHFEDGQFGGGAEAVLDAPQDTVRAFVFAFELQDNIDDMLQNFGPGDAALLGDMADKDDGNARLLGEAEQDGGRLLDLGDAAGRGLDALAVHRLDGVDNHQVGGNLLRLGDDVVHQGLGVDIAVGKIAAETFGPHLDLADAFLTRDIERLERRPHQRNLQAQGGLADARLAADQHQGALDDATAEETVHLGAAEGDPVLAGELNLPQRNGLMARPRHGRRKLPLRRARCHRLLHKGIPFPAGGTLSHPLGAFIAARCAEPDAL